MRFLVYACLCSISESAHSLQHYEYPFSSKSHWEFPASEYRFGNIVIIVVIIVIIIPIFLKQFVSPSWYQRGLQVNESRELCNRSNELFPWSRNAKEFLFSVKNYTYVLESNLMQRNFIRFSCIECLVSRVLIWLVYWADCYWQLLTLQCGVTSTARHSVNITCRGVTSPARHAARSHSFVYISTS